MSKDEKMLTIADAITGEIIAEHLMYKGRRMTVDGQELPDPTPVAPPVGYKKQPSMADIIREQVRLAKLAEEAGVETFEEANDFEVGDDFDPDSPYETEELDGMVGQAIKEGRLIDTPEGPAIAPLSAASAGDGSPPKGGAKPEKPKASSPSPEPVNKGED